MSLLNWTVDLPTESMHMLNDLVRMGVIQLVVQFLFFVVSPVDNPFFSTMFLQTIGFVLVGVLVYWLLVRNLFSFQSVHATPAQPPAPLVHADAAATDSTSPVSSADADRPAESAIPDSGLKGEQ